MATTEDKPPTNNNNNAYTMNNNDFEGVQWTDFFEDNEGQARGVLQTEWKLLSSKQLRTICSRLSIKGVKNVKKGQMIDMLVQTYQNRKAYNALASRDRQNQESPSVPRKQVQCSFRLINILFSDGFASDFAHIGDTVARLVIDSGKAANDEHFWARVQCAFLEANDHYDELKFIDDDVFSGIDHINPAIIVPHDWKKLRAIWKGVNADYKATLANFTVSGTHDSNFYSFCHGKLDIYYLRKHLELRPELNSMVEGNLPSECALNSDMTGQEIYFTAPQSDMSDSKQSSSTKGKKKRKHGESEIALAIKEFGKSQARLDRANQKLRYMEKEDLRREDEHRQQTHKLLFEEWERIQTNIRLLRKDIHEDWMDDDTKTELQDDIDALAKRKNELAVELGLKPDISIDT
jgi:hypothetical protein